MTLKIIAVVTPNISIPSAASSGPSSRHGGDIDYVAVAQRGVVLRRAIKSRSEVLEFAASHKHQRPSRYLDQMCGERHRRGRRDDGRVLPEWTPA